MYRRIRRNSSSLYEVCAQREAGRGATTVSYILVADTSP